MFIVLGLGNPGREYQSTRHNVGFMTLDILADRYNIDVVWGRAHRRRAGGACEAGYLYEQFRLGGTRPCELV